MGRCTTKAIVGLLSVWAALIIAGCDGDSGTAGPPRTPTRTVGTPTVLQATEPPTPLPPTALPSATPAVCSFSPTPGASATTTGSPTATYTPVVCPADTATPTAAGACTATATSTGTFGGPFTSTPTPGLAVLSLFDANPRYTSGVFLPLSAYTAESVRVLSTAQWTDAARRPAGAAADGATLLLIGVQLVSARDDAAVQLRIDAGGLPSGGLFAVDDQRLVDRTAGGGTIDALPDGPTDLLVDTVLIDDQRWAFALYRAPRDFDAGAALMSRSRPVILSAFQGNVLLNEGIFDVFRPLVIFLHGTAGDTSNWDHFPLWRDSANELRGFQGGVLPFYADRISFQWIALASGHLSAGAATILPQIGRALESWKERINAAATQADVVTHSYGGPTARQVVQTQPDANPLTVADQLNFRAVTNWGHGLVRKLVTLAATHRGSALANSVAYLNQLGNGVLRNDACVDGVDIGAGALGDQLVLSPALRGLRETRVAGHAIIGSGTVQFADAPSVSSCESGGCEVCYAASGYHGEYSLYQLQDTASGPYQGAGNLSGSICGFSLFCEDFNYDSYSRLTNYVFNLAYSPPFTTADCDLSTDYPNYDLIVSACSSQGQQPGGAYSTVDDIDPALRGRLSHTQLLSTPAVSDRVRFLLHQPTASEYFAPFAATGEPTCLEEQMANVGSADGLSTGTPCAGGPDNGLINSCYAPCNSCEANADTPPCFVEYRVVPNPLVLRQIGQPAPVFVYGRVTRGPLDGQWTNVQSLANSIWCSVTMSSSNQSIAKVTTWKDISGAPDQSGINVVEAVADGQSSISLMVENDSDGPLGLDVTVDTTPAAEAE